MNSLKIITADVKTVRATEKPRQEGNNGKVRVHCGVGRTKKRKVQCDFWRWKREIMNLM